MSTPTLPLVISDLCVAFYLTRVPSVYSGGMGLTGGLVDAGNLFDCLYGIATGQLDDSILDKYSDVRIKAYKEIIDPVSSGNIRRLWDRSPEAIKSDMLFQNAKRAETDKEFEKEMKQVSDASQKDVKKQICSNVLVCANY